MTKEEQLASALRTLEQYVHDLSAAAGKTDEYAQGLWQRIRNSTGVLRELAYYHDNGAFWDGCEVAGYHLTDILVWQVDHFKAYLDRHDEVKRWHPEELLLSALDIMLQMEEDPQPFIDKMRGETGTDYVGKY